MSSYFAENYNNLKLAIQKDDNSGLRRAQIGAIHSIGAHFSVKKNQVL